MQTSTDNENVDVVEGDRDRRATPAFRVIAEQLADAIRGGRVSGALPSEQELARTHGVSRVTMRRALGVVADAGLAQVTWGKGWTVTHGPLSEPANTLLSVTELAAERSLSARSRVLLAEIRPAGLDEAEELDIAPGADVYVPRPGAAQRRHGLRTTAEHGPRGSRAGDRRGRLLRPVAVRDAPRSDGGSPPTRADYAVEARPADEENATHLGVEVGSPLLWATQRTFDQQGTVIETGWSAYPWDRYRFRATLTRRPRSGRGAVLSAAPTSPQPTVDG